MRVLLDENLDWRLVRYFDADFQVTTVSRQGWKGKRNGDLLAQAAESFDAPITMDKGIEYEQNLRKYAINIILISAKSNRIQDLQPDMFRVNQILRTLEPGQVSYVTVTI